jgi:hypothetical protein
MEARRVVRRRGSHFFLENRLTDGGKVVLRAGALYSRNIHATHFF